MFDLTGRVILITGAASGIGKTVAREFLRQGAKVAIADLAEPPDDIRSWPRADHLLSVRADVRDFEQVTRLCAKVTARFGRIDVLINNASTYSRSRRRSFLEIDSQEWEDTFAVNVMGVFHCVKAALPHWRSQGGGKVVNIASDAPLKGLPGLLDYVSSKGAVISMTRALARELGPENIAVNCVAPGYTRHDDSPSFNPDRDRAVRAARCLQRTAIPEDVVGALTFLCSPASDFMTGQTLVVDGGEVFV